MPLPVPDPAERRVERTLGRAEPGEPERGHARVEPGPGRTAAGRPIGIAMKRTPTVEVSSCPHRALMPALVDVLAAGRLDPGRVITEDDPMTDVVEACRTVDVREPGWVGVAVRPAA